MGGRLFRPAFPSSILPPPIAEVETEASRGPYSSTWAANFRSKRLQTSGPAQLASVGHFTETPRIRIAIQSSGNSFTESPPSPWSTPVSLCVPPFCRRRCGPKRRAAGGVSGFSGRGRFSPRTPSALDPSPLLRLTFHAPRPSRPPLPCLRRWRPGGGDPLWIGWGPAKLENETLLWYAPRSRIGSQVLDHRVVARASCSQVFRGPDTAALLTAVRKHTVQSHPEAEVMNE